MKLSTYLGSWSGAQILTRLLGVALILSIVTNATLGLLMIRREQLVVLVPPSLERQASLLRAQADEHYLAAWGWYAATMIGNVTQANASFIKASIEPLLDPGIYHATIKRLEQQLDQLARDRVTLKFEPRRTLHEQATGKLFVTGLSTVQSLAGGEQRETRTYEFEIEIRHYRPLLTHIDTYTGQPRTADVRQREQATSGGPERRSG